MGFWRRRRKRRSWGANERDGAVYHVLSLVTRISGVGKRADNPSSTLDRAIYIYTEHIRDSISFSFLSLPHEEYAETTPQTSSKLNIPFYSTQEQSPIPTTFLSKSSKDKQVPDKREDTVMPDSLSLSLSPVQRRQKNAYHRPSSTSTSLLRLKPFYSLPVKETASARSPDPPSRRSSRYSPYVPHTQQTIQRTLYLPFHPIPFHSNP